MATIQTFKGVVRLTKAQLNTLINNGSLSDGTTTITYDPQNTIYLTPQEQASTSDAGVILIATDQDVQTGTNTTKAVTPAQLKTAIIGIGTVFNLKGTKATASQLPATGNSIGDVWYVVDESVGYVWLNDGTTDKWEQLGLPIDLSGYVQYSDIINNLTSTASDKPLSALQGKALNDMLNTLTQELVDTQDDVADNMADISTLQTAKANKDLSNVTYPQVVANGIAQQGDCDRVVETFISSDGNTWYRKWASGWKECGVNKAPSDGWTTIVLPIEFANSNYTVSGVPLTLGEVNTTLMSAKISNKTTSTFRTVILYTGDGSSIGIGAGETVYFYCCGY